MPKPKSYSYKDYNDPVLAEWIDTITTLMTEDLATARARTEAIQRESARKEIQSLKEAIAERKSEGGDPVKLRELDEAWRRFGVARAREERGLQGRNFAALVLTGGFPAAIHRTKIDKVYVALRGPHLYSEYSICHIILDKCQYASNGGWSKGTIGLESTSIGVRVAFLPDASWKNGDPWSQLIPWQNLRNADFIRPLWGQPTLLIANRTNGVDHVLKMKCPEAQIESHANQVIEGFQGMRKEYARLMGANRLPTD